MNKRHDSTIHAHRPDTLQNAVVHWLKRRMSWQYLCCFARDTPGKRQSLDDYKKMADAFNVIGENAKKAGVKFGYHNHGYGLKEVNGRIPLRVLLDNTDASLVFLEMDLYWTTAGGADPVELLNHYRGRYRLVHIKDMAKKVHFSGDGGELQTMD